MLPMTKTMYVQGTLTNVEKVLVDIGTGYYAEKVCFLCSRPHADFPCPKNIADAKDFYKRKVEFIGKQLEKLQNTVVEKRSQYNTFSDIYQMRMAQAAKATATKA